MLKEIRKFFEIVFEVLYLLLRCFIANYYWLYINYRNGITKSMTCLVGKTAIVTGGNSGLGFMTSMLLASRGCKVIIACRRNAQKEIDEIKRETKNPHISFKNLDLSRFASVRKFADEIKKEETKIDILVNNAGIGFENHAITEDGLDLITQSNYLGHFLMIHLLIDLLKAADGARIVALTSALANLHNLSVKDLYPFTPITATERIQIYSNSKAYIVLMVQEMAKKLEKFGITVNAADPGVAKTAIFDVLRNEDAQLEMRIFTDILQFFTATDIYTAAQTGFHLATSEKIGNGMKYFRCRPMPKWKILNDTSFCEEVWKETEKIVKLRPEERL